MHPSVRRNARLAAIEARIDWGGAVAAVLAGVKPGRRGAPPYPALLMFKALVLQQWYGLSDPGLDEAAFAAVAGQLDAAGLVVRAGTLIDASLIAAQGRPPAVPDPATLAPGASRLVGSAREPDANWTRRGARRVFGYKLHLAVDQGSGLIRRVLMTGADVNDTVTADALVIGDEQAVWADKPVLSDAAGGVEGAYDSHARRARLQALGIRDRICRRGNKHHPPTRWPPGATA